MDADGFLHLTGRAGRPDHPRRPQYRPGHDALLRHPAVAAGGGGRPPDEHAGELPVAYVMLKAGATIAAEQLLAEVRELVAERAAAPVRTELLAQIPLTAIGKIAKAELHARRRPRVRPEAGAAASRPASRCGPTAGARRGAVVDVTAPQAESRPGRGAGPLRLSGRSGAGGRKGANMSCA
nr:hypothetical protein [Duganella sp. BJB1802]